MTTTHRLVESCPLTKLDGGLKKLHTTDNESVDWLSPYSMQQFWRQDFFHRRTTSLEQSAARSQTSSRPVQTVTEDIFDLDSAATAQCELFLTVPNRNILTYVICICQQQQCVCLSEHDEWQGPSGECEYVHAITRQAGMWTIRWKYNPRASCRNDCSSSTGWRPRVGFVSDYFYHFSSWQRNGWELNPWASQLRVLYTTMPHMTVVAFWKLHLQNDL